ncbi:unnamed protein product [Allacma fusca]|uniref:BTB domain-containing protein n=1 Tax=Allacma fusca TaxID=39272 RepID=A0A8J2NXK0_9HEXA|nr:unnamed protein product [Allacma fusca]
MRSIFVFNISLDTKAEANFYQLNFVCNNIRQRPFYGYMDDKKRYLSFQNFSVRLKLFIGSLENSFTKWLHVDFPNNNLKSNNTLNSSGSQLASFNDPNFISKDKVAQMLTRAENLNQKVRISCELEIFGSLVEIDERIRLRTERLHKDFEDLSFPGSLSFPLSKSQYKHIAGGQSRDCYVRFISANLKNSVQANKFLLAAQSPVMRQMLFETDMVEKSTGLITVPDETSFTALKTFVTLAQSEGVLSKYFQGDVQHFLEVLSFAHKYQVDRVVDICIMIVMAVQNISLTIEDALKLHSAGELYNIPDFTARAFQWMKWKSETSQGKAEVLAYLKTSGAEFVLDFCYFLL